MAGSRDSGKGMAGARSRGRGFRHAGVAALPRVAPVAEKLGFAESEVLLRWPDIAGAALAALCHPVKVSYGRGAGLGATLTVRAEGAVAPEVEHLAPQIVERVNAYYGYRAISRLKITQATGFAGEAKGLACGFGEDAPRFDGHVGGGDRARPASSPWRGEARPPADTTPAAMAEARKLASGISSPALRDALAQMGGYVLSRSRRPAPTD